MPKKKVTEVALSPEAQQLRAEASRQIVNVFDAFKNANIWPAPNYGNKTERKAIEKLLLMWGRDEVVSMVTFYGQRLQVNKFLPKAFKPSLFLEKAGIIGAHIKATCGTRKRGVSLNSDGSIKRG